MQIKLIVMTWTLVCVDPPSSYRVNLMITSALKRFSGRSVGWPCLLIFNDDGLIKPTPIFLIQLRQLFILLLCLSIIQLLITFSSPHALVFIYFFIFFYYQHHRVGPPCDLIITFVSDFPAHWLAACLVALCCVFLFILF